MKNMFSFLGRFSRQEQVSARRRRIDLGEALPDYTIYAIGDVHGRLDLLAAAEDRITADVHACGRPGLVILLGDYIDRGPQSAGVMDHLCRPLGHGMLRLVLCGNHDDAFLQFTQAPEQHLRWLDFGGKQTLLSYGIDFDHLMARGNGGFPALKSSMEHAIPQEHIQLMRDMPICARIGNHFFVHAGLRPGIPPQEQTDEDMMWIREPFLSTGTDLPFTIVHGHTPVDTPSFGPGRIGIDTGAVFSGNLTVLRIEAGQAAVMGPDGRG